MSLISFGCERNQSNDKSITDGTGQAHHNTNSASASFSDGLDGLTLLRNLTTKYGLAKSYRDRGILRLSYTLQDKAIVEPHPFATCWERGSRLSVRLFQAHLQADGKLMSCYIYDINTANLDEQQLFLPIDRELPLHQLFEDSIVRHYLGGYADLPLDETDKNQVPRLIPPPVSLVSGQLPFGWIQHPEIAKRLPDQLLDGENCYVVRSQFDQMTADIWINQATNVITQISMPLKVMDRQVLTAGEIKNVELLMQFKEAQLDIPLSTSEATWCSTALKPKATPVRKFVSVPDPFPSERIGQLVPKFELLRPNGDRVNYLHFDGKTTALIWAATDEWTSIVEKLERWKDRRAADSAELGLVYSDEDLKHPETSSIAPKDGLAALAKRAGLNLFFDRQLQTSSKFQLRILPAVAVIGPNSRLEFVGSLEKQDWETELATVLEKVKRGVDVAGEMKTAYQEFQETYSKLRVAASARSLLNLPEPAPVAITAANKPFDIALAKSLKPAIVWNSKRLTQPGNIAINHFRSPPSLFIMDGWRSVVELDLSGKELARFKLDLPRQSAVSCLRLVPATGNLKPDEAHFAVFNVQGEKIYLFDRAWKLVTTLPPSDFTHDGVRDAIFLPRDKGNPLILMALANDGGCVEFDNDNRVMKQVFRSRADSISKMDDRVYFANPAGWGLLSDDTSQTASGDDLLFQKMISLDAAKRSPGFVGITSVDRDNNWFFGQIGPKGKLVWRQPIGSQLFENEIEPLSCCYFQFDQHDGEFGAESGPSTVVVAIADSGNRITLVSGEGSFLGQFSAPAGLTGIALLEHQSALHLILSTQQGIANYRLSAAGATAQPVSDKQH
jgi:hypothetical protein